MALDATATPTALGIPKFNPAVDAPSGRGFNAAMDSIDTIITARTLPTGVVNSAVVWNGSAWVAGTLVDANVAANAGIQHSKLLVPRCHAQHSVSGYSVADSTFTQLVLATELTDNDNMYNPANGFITIRTAGVYFIGGWGSWAPNGTGIRHADILYTPSGGGASAMVGDDRNNLTASYSVGWSLSMVQNCAVNDTFVSRGWQNSGASLTLNAYRSAEFYAFRVG